MSTFQQNLNFPIPIAPTIPGDVEFSSARVNTLLPVDTLGSYTPWKVQARAASTANLTLLGEQTVDGVVLVEGDRILVKDQTTGSEDGIYLVRSTSWSRTGDLEPGTNAAAIAIYVTEGTLNGSTLFVCTNVPGSDVVGIDNLTFSTTVGGGNILTDGYLFVGNGSNIATGVAPSGDVASVANTGAFTFSTVNANVGSFTNTNLTVNAKGLITAASNGTGGIGGSNLNVQYNDSGTIAGSNFFNFDPTPTSFPNFSGVGATSVGLQTIGSELTNASLTAGGTGYTAGSGLSTSGGSGTGLTVTIIVGAGIITSIYVDNFGSGYALADSLTVTGGGGSGGTFDLTFSAFLIGRIQAPDATVTGGVGGLLSISSGAGNGAGVGGPLNIDGGYSGTTNGSQGGGVFITGGLVLATNGNGGVSVLAGAIASGTGDGGSVSCLGGDAVTTGTGGDAIIQAGDGGTLGTPGNLQISGGVGASSGGDGGNISIIGGSTVTTGEGGTVTITGGPSSGGDNGGPIAIVSGTSDGGGPLSTLTINAQGTGYTQGDTITVSGGTGGTFTIDIFPIGNITAVGTLYSTATSVPTSGGSGSGMIVDIVDNGGGGLQSVTITTTGSGYVTGDTITVAQVGSGLDGTFTFTFVGTIATIGSGYSDGTYATTGGTGAADMTVDVTTATSGTISVTTSTGGSFGNGGNINVVLGTSTGTGNDGVLNITTSGIISTLENGGITMTKGAVTQGTSTSTAVTLNTKQGIITTFTSTAAADNSVAFTVNNSLVVATDMVLCNVIDYTGAVDGTAGIPNVYVDNITASSFDIVVSNCGSTALSGVLKIGFMVL